MLKILTKKDFLKYKTPLLELYDPVLKRPEEYWKSLNASTFIIAAFEDDIIIGASRIMSDLYMCAMIFDVLVHPDYRNRGIGGKIIQMTVEFCREKRIKNVSLVTDPSHPWLPDFYKKFGFTVDDSRGMYMILEK